MMALLDRYNIGVPTPFTHFDKVMKVQLFRADAAPGNVDSVVIECPEGGPKPGLYFSTEMLPGGVATQFKLTITNFSAEVDIGLFTHMIVEIGYRTSGNFREFTASIFSAYIESPNPNGRTTLTGIIGDWMIKGLREVNRTIVFRAPTVTVGELIWGIAQGLGEDGKVESPNNKDGGLGIDLDVDLPDWVLRDKLTIGGPDGSRTTTYWTESGYACLNWLIEKLGAYGEGLVSTLLAKRVPQEEAENYRVMASFQDNKLLVFMKGFTRSLDTKSIQYTDLNMVSSVTFQGAALSVVAPWSPLLMPGSLFHMQSRYFRGRTSPQQVIDQSARDPDDLYRVITMSAEYETNGPTNSMKLLAIRNAAFVSSEIAAEKLTAVEKEYEARSNVYVEDAAAPPIIFGKEPALTEGERKESWGVTADTFDPTDGLIRKVGIGETLGSVAIEFYGDLTYYKTPAEGNIDHVGEVFPGSYLWPVISIGNYCMYRRGEEGFGNYSSSPDQLVEGQNVFIPTVTNIDDLAFLHDVFQNIADHWMDNRGATEQEPAEIGYLRLLCYYLELV